MYRGENIVIPDSLPYSTIPRIIHHTYPIHDLPDSLSKNVENIKNINPNWEHKLYDDADIEDFISSQFGNRMLRIYRSIDPNYGAARADLFRYLVIYIYGGVYLDIKSSIVLPLDENLLEDDRYVLSKWRNSFGEEHEGAGLSGPMKRIPGGEFQNWHIISCPRHPLLKLVIDSIIRNILNYNPWINGVGKRAVIRMTGPIAYTITITKNLSQYEVRQVRNETLLGMTYNTLPGVSDHKNLFVNHYSKNTDPLIIPSERTKFVWNTYSTIYRAMHPAIRIFKWLGMWSLAKLRFIKYKIKNSRS
ncbi:glycosyltransferase [Methylobacterium sp. WL119]|nr:glycosyltransferase [Methylobacterium sp. WL119]